MSGNHSTQPRGYEPTHAYDVDSESPSTNSAVYKRYPLYKPAEWLLEVASLILSLVLLLVIVYIFWITDDKPLSYWKFPTPEFTISLNAVISILTTGFSAAMMHGVSEFISQLKWLHFKKGPQKLENFEKFDEASRGPWGSFKFLFSITWNLAAVGALITICRLTIAPLAQQVIDYPERNVNKTDSNATFGYAHEYNRNLSGYMFNHRMSSAPHDPKMQSAILQGIYDIDIPQIFSCPGACKWDSSYISLGFVSACKNVTLATLRTEDCPAVGGSHKGCNMTTPGGIRLSTHHADTDLQTTFRLNASSTMGETDITLPEGFPDLVTFAVYRATSDQNFTPSNINITECALSLTAYEYSQSHANGSDFQFDGIKEIKLPHKRWNIYGGQGSFDGYIWTNASKAEGLPKLTLGWVDIKSLQFFFQSDMISAEWVDGNFENKNPGISAALIGDVDLEERFNKMAASMTDYLRAGPNRKTAKGQRVDKVTFVSIRWVWLIGPAAIELAALVFALVTIAQNRKSSAVPLWKSSALAVLACRHEQGVGDGVGLIRSKVKDIKEIEETAEKVQVQLE